MGSVLLCSFTHLASCGKVQNFIATCNISLGPYDWLQCEVHADYTALLIVAAGTQANFLDKTQSKIKVYNLNSRFGEK